MIQQANRRTINVIIDYIYKKQNKTSQINDSAHRTIHIILQKDYDNPQTLEKNTCFTEIEQKIIDVLKKIELEIENETLQGEPNVIIEGPIISYFNSDSYTQNFNNIPFRTIKLNICSITKEIKIHSLWFDNNFVNKTELKPLQNNQITLTTNNNSYANEINRIYSL